jgi:Ca-activated chloride channel family protein
MTRTTRNLFIFCLFLLTTHSAFAATIDDMGGNVQAMINGKKILFPALKTDIRADIQGDLATVTVKQVFQNPTDQVLNAQYLFPVNKDAAIYGMTMIVGDEIVEAVIQRKEEAKKIFDNAQKEGKAASLLTQHRPNMFTQNIANLMPGQPITVTLRYTQTVPKVDDYYELVVPLIVGPRYESAIAGKPVFAEEGEITVTPPEIRSDTTFGTWELEKLPHYPEVAGLSIPDTIDAARVGIEVHLRAGTAISHVHSRTHSIHASGEDSNKQVKLSKERIIDNADFVLRYQLADTHTSVGLLTAKDDKSGYFSLKIEPPALPAEAEITPREMVFVLDTSGSMNGMPMTASKIFMKHALKHLRPNDYFRIIRFSNNASEFTSTPVPATPENLTRGMEYVELLSTGGGTEMQTAITQAFAVPPQNNTLRIVVFLTDGYIGHEASLLQQINDTIGNARIYAFGIGSSVNRYLLDEMGRAGRGFARFIDPTEAPEDVAIELANKLESPVLTDISIDWGDMNVSHVTPSVIPDLFAGGSIRVQGKYTGSGTHTIRVNGKVVGHNASMPTQVKLPDENTPESHKAIALIWARSQIADWMRQLNTQNTEDKTALKNAITQLGLDYSLMTQWTSFVAVSRKVVNVDPATAKDVNVPLPKVKGVNKEAYGKLPTATQAQHFAGHSTPEPEFIGGLLIIALAGFVTTRRRKIA